MTNQNDEFTVIDRKSGNAEKQKRRLAQKQKYIEWCETVWPGMLIDFLNQSMQAYEENQPQKRDESLAEYNERFQKALSAAERRHATCKLPIQDCLDRPSHSRCEDKRRAAYEIYMKDQKYTEGFDTITYVDEMPSVPEIVAAPTLVVEEKKEKVVTPKKKVKKVKEVVEDVVPELVPEPAAPPHIKKEKKVKEKTQEELDIDALCSELSTMPDKKTKPKKK